MRPTLIALFIIGAALYSVSAAGQQATEQYIPIGESPGLSGSDTYLGEILSVETAEHAFFVDGPDGLMRVAVSPQTRIYLDRSGVGESNSIGHYANCEAGRLVEVLLAPDGTAAWVKVLEN